MPVENSYVKSIGKQKNVAGHMIKKMPLRAYLNALDVLQNLPGELADRLIPGKSLIEILDMIDKKELSWLKIIVTALSTVPDYFMDLISELLGIERETLENDDRVGPGELVEMLEVWYQINGIANFTRRLLKLMRTAKTWIPQQETGESSSTSSSQSQLN
jgi:hypothetical protein